MSQTKNHRRIIRRFDLVDHGKGRFSGTGNSFGRENDLIITGLNVARGQGSAVVKLNAFA